MYTEGAEPPRIGVKGVITMTKQVRFKSTVKEASAVSEPNQFLLQHCRNNRRGCFDCRYVIIQINNDKLVILRVFLSHVPDVLLQQSATRPALIEKRLYSCFAVFSMLQTLFQYTNIILLAQFLSSKVMNSSQSLCLL